MRSKDPTDTVQAGTGTGTVRLIEVADIFFELKYFTVPVQYRCTVQYDPCRMALFITVPPDSTGTARGDYTQGD